MGLPRTSIHSLWLFPVLLIAMGGSAEAQSLSVDFGEGGGTTARILQLLVVLTVLSVAPSILIMMTSFTRIVIVLSLLRSAMGVQQTPPNMVMVSLALFLTAFIMMPTFEEIYLEAFKPLADQEIDEQEALERGAMPLRRFMLSHVRPQDLQLFLEASESGVVADPEETPMQALVPAFMISELRRAFEIGFLMFLPFIIIDMTVASVLMSMGMMMLPPIIMSLPFKLIFFVLVDGWYLVAGSLLKSYGGG